jgi:hypothetical protein
MCGVALRFRSHPSTIAMKGYITVRLYSFFSKQDRPGLPMSRAERALRTYSLLGYSDCSLANASRLPMARTDAKVSFWAVRGSLFALSQL